jgi:hypothetical protein
LLARKDDKHPKLAALDEHSTISKQLVLREVSLTRKRARRLGCGCLLVLWFAFLVVVPCGVFSLLLSEQHEILLTKSAVPDDALRIWLISGTDNRGIGVANGYITTSQANEVCTQTDFRFLLWQGKPPQKDKSCACYEKKADFYSATLMDTAACFAPK